jgi:predicted aldo/keto reductase-like oxidoreductase
LLQQGRFIGKASDAPEIRGAMSIALSEAQCLSYALSQPGVSTTVPGCANLDEIKAALSYLDASAEEKDYHSIDSNALWKLGGKCVYCNHCLPCPEGINIGHVLKLLDAAERSMSREIADKVRMLDKSALDCVGCGDCLERCPFGVPVIERMERAQALFGSFG